MSLALSLALGLAATGFPFGTSSAQPFSADLFTTDTTARLAKAAGKLYASEGKVRIETAGFPDGYFLIERDAAHFVRPSARVFMEARQSSRLAGALIPVDPDDPCRQWKIMAKIGGMANNGGRWKCDRIGTDSLNGRATIKFRTISPWRLNEGWIDPQLDFPVSVRFDDGTRVDLRNISEAPQPLHLFEIPRGYRKFDPQRLIDRIKSSDVWVEPPTIYPGSQP
jgi:hypothetical protein